MTDRKPTADWGLIITVVMIFVLITLMLSGCQSLPSMQYCDQVTYTRDGNQVTIHAECKAPMGDIVNISPGI